MNTKEINNTIGFIPLTLQEIEWMLWNIPGRNRTGTEDSIRDKIAYIMSKGHRMGFTPELLRPEICTFFNVSEENILSRSKKQHLADVRAVISIVAHELFPELNLSRIGDLTGRKHSDVCHHYEMMRNSKEVAELYWKFKKTLS